MRKKAKTKTNKWIHRTEAGHNVPAQTFRSIEFCEIDKKNQSIFMATQNAAKLQIYVEYCLEF